MSGDSRENTIRCQTPTVFKPRTIQGKQKTQPTLSVVF